MIAGTLAGRSLPPGSDLRSFRFANPVSPDADLILDEDWSECAGYHTYWTMVTLIRSAREVQTTSSGRLSVAPSWVTSRASPPNQGVPSRQTVWLLSGAPRVTT